ncbi:hypothetical protein [Deinococcus misasensis]|uniref:DUF6848 family protein n=1 Tax=Deinococcus misasensis TaxID=392413 RepID=UPI0005507BF2|nr:hypothetical protein [Deinococcus misasensis]
MSENEHLYTIVVTLDPDAEPETGATEYRFRKPQKDNLNTFFKKSQDGKIVEANQNLALQCVLPEDKKALAQEFEENFGLGSRITKKLLESRGFTAG